jgi:hypothetical protein
MNPSQKVKKTYRATFSDGESHTRTSYLEYNYAYFAVFCRNDDENAIHVQVGFSGTYDGALSAAPSVTSFRKRKHIEIVPVEVIG